MHRAFVSELPKDGLLDRETEHRFSRVLRLKMGVPVELFDGQGNCLRGEFGSPLTQQIQVSEDTPKISLIQALVSMDKLESIVQHATELGVSEIVLFKAERSQPGSLKLERLNKIAQDASRQSGRAWVPAITLSPQPVSWGPEEVCLLCDPTATESLDSSFPPSPRLRRTGRWNDRISVLIGPEGGFSESERARFQVQGAKPVRIAKYILRTETAGLTVLAQIQGKLL